MKAIYLDVQNIHKKTLDYGWRIDRKKFFVYCTNKYHPDVIYFAVGYVATRNDRYRALQEIGYTMLFKETLFLANGEIKV